MKSQGHLREGKTDLEFVPGSHWNSSGHAEQCSVMITPARKTFPIPEALGLCDNENLLFLMKASYLCPKISVEN